MVPSPLSSSSRARHPSSRVCTTAPPQHFQPAAKASSAPHHRPVIGMSRPATIQTPSCQPLNHLHPAICSANPLHPASARTRKQDARRTKMAQHKAQRIIIQPVRVQSRNPRLWINHNLPLASLHHAPYGINHNHLHPFFTVRIPQSTVRISSAPCAFSAFSAARLGPYPSVKRSGI